MTAQFEPNLVVVVFFLRDGTPHIGSIRLIRGVRDEMNELWTNSPLFRNSYLYRLIRERSAQRELSGNYLKEMNSAYVGSPEQTRVWRDAQAHLLWMRSECERRGVGFAFVIFPVLFELEDRYPLSDVVLEIEEFCENHEFACLSLLPSFQHRDASTLWVSALDQHPNADGHAIAADAIYEFMMTEMSSRQ
jgi:hypothetical protein